MDYWVIRLFFSWFHVETTRIYGFSIYICLFFFHVETLRIYGFRHASKSTPRVWQLFHTSSSKAPSINDTNIHLLARKYQLLNSCSKWWNKILKSPNINFKTNISTKVLLSKQFQTQTIANRNQIMTFKQSPKKEFKQTS